MTRKKSISTLASVYIGTVIGAGFASGQEILQFFGKQGMSGILGVGLSTLLLAAIASKVLKKVYRQKIRNFEEFGAYYFSKRILTWINLILAFLLLVGYFVMLAGSGAIVKEHFDFPAIYGIIGMSLLSFIVFNFGVSGIAKANNLIVPLLIGVIFVVTFFVITNNRFFFSNLNVETFLRIDSIKLFGTEITIKNMIQIKTGWIWSAFVYASHNSIGATVVMTSLLPLIYDERAAEYGGILGALALGFMASLILLCLLILYTDIIGLEVPMVAIAHSIGNIYKQIYSFILLLAMFTTAIANGYACILRFSYMTGWREGLVTIIICLIAIPLATLGFKNLVSFFYPLFGYLGFLLIGTILVKR